MKVLMITGDKRFGPGNPRFELQKSVVEEFAVMYWGRGSLFPKLPKGHFDVVTAQDPFFRGHLAGHLAWFFGARLNLQVHTDLSALPWLKRWWAGFNLRKADSIRVVSEKIKKQVEDFGVKEKITVLPIFIEVQNFRDVVRKEHEGKNILWIGRFEEEKNPLLSIEILKNVLNTIPDAKLTMLGAGTMQEEIIKRAMNLPVSIPGWQDPLPFLAMADVVLCTSLYESWGASMIEALAARVPVVAPDVGVAREAGAVVVLKVELARAVISVLKKEEKGVLKLNLPSATEWAIRWLQTL